MSLLRSRSRRAADRVLVYKLGSLLLQYPDAELRALAPQIAAAAQELADEPAGRLLAPTVRWWCDTPVLDVERHYVEVFDTAKRSGLYLTYYGEGDRRERGAALLRLARMYRAAGFPMQERELPDFLPVMLEFASSADAAAGDLVLHEHRAALDVIARALTEAQSPYAGAVEAVCLTLGAPTVAQRVQAGQLVADGPPTELVGLEPFAPPEVMPSSGARR
jgi:nitrate reductase delta subunit